MPEPATLGAEFARALAAKDFSRVLDLMHPEIDFRGLTPNRSWETSDADAVVSGVLREWFEESDEIEALERLESDAFADRERVGYRFSVRNPVIEIRSCCCRRACGSGCPRSTWRGSCSTSSSRWI